MATIIPTRGARSGSAAAQAYAISEATTYTIKNDGNVLLLISQGETETTVTIAAQGSFASAQLSDLVITIDTLGMCVLGPFPTQAYNDAHGYMTVTIDSTSCELYAVAL